MDCPRSSQRSRFLLTEIRAKLGRSRQGGGACADAGSISEGASVSMDIEQLVYEAGRPHDAASLLDRMSRE